MGSKQKQRSGNDIVHNSPKFSERSRVRFRSRRSRSSRLGYGDLEERLALTTFLVTTTADTNNSGVDGFVSLREAITAANTNAAFGDAPAGDADGDLIRFASFLADSTIFLSLGQISISDDVLIQGGASNLTIQDNADTRMFEISSSERVGFSKLTFAEGNAAIGGAMTSLGSGTTLIVDSTFQNNEATGSGGGAIYNVGGNLNVINTTFENNQASGSAGGGGAIYSATTGTTYINGGSMFSNSANQSGGAIKVIGGTYFSVGLQIGAPGTGNVAGPDGSANPGDGGGLHASGSARVVIDGGAFDNNAAARNGGGIWIGGSSTLFMRNAADVTNNSAGGDSIGDGGGGIFNDGGAGYINNANIESNLANGTSGSGGAIYSNAGSILLNSSTISNNAAARTGGGIHSVNGFVQLNSSDLTLNDVGITLSTTVGHGGGLYAAGTASVVINNGQVSNNQSTFQGGGIWADTDSLVFFRNTANLNENTTSETNSTGGGVYTKGYLQALDSFFLRNETDVLGGGLFIADTGRARIANANFTGNNARTRGGGIYNDGYMYVTDSSFRNNIVNTSGGAFYTGPTATTISSGLTFSGNLPNNTN